LSSRRCIQALAPALAHFTQKLTVFFVDLRHVVGYRWWSLPRRPAMIHSMAAPALSVVIPVYNGARTVPELVAALEALPVAGGHEIILVNDGSEDDSLDVCRMLMAHARVPLIVVDLARNFGEHNAVMAGLSRARGAHVITMDDDLQNPPAEVLRLLEHAQRSGKDVVYTCYATKEHAAWRNFGSRFANWCAERLLDKPKGLYLSSFRCLSAFVVAQLLRYTGPFPYVDGLILQCTRSIDRLTVQHLPRAHGRSNYTPRRLIRLWLNILVNFSVLPLRAATVLGFLMSGAGLAGTVWVIAEALLSKTPRGWASLAVAILLLSGVQLTVLGLIGEYLGRVYLTANGKPQWVAREVLRGGTPAAWTAEVVSERSDRLAAERR
jgi:glycosyltransferase involved in cell wall biosynthesis